MAGIGSDYETRNEVGQIVRQAKIISVDEKAGIMTIECPVDIQHFEVPIGTKEFLCPIDNTLLLIG